MVRINNLELVNLLIRNGRASYVDLAKHFGVSETAVRTKMKKLEDEGIIQQYTIYIDHRKLGLNFPALIGLDIDTTHYSEIVEKLKARDTIIDVYSSTGLCMFLLKTICKDNEEFDEFIHELESWTGVTKVCPSMITNRIK